MMPVATGSIEALRLLPPSGVQYDEDGLQEFSLTVEGLPLARGSPTVTSSQAFVTLLAASTITPGDVSIRMFDICRQLTCSSAEALRFPLLGPSENEDPIPDVEVGCCHQRVLARLAAAFTLTLLREDISDSSQQVRPVSHSTPHGPEAGVHSSKCARCASVRNHAPFPARTPLGEVCSLLSITEMGCGGSAGMRTLSAEGKSKVEELFDKMDKDTSGTITKEEAHKFFSSFAKVNAKAMFDEVDDDGNGSITKAEWVGFWNQVRAAGYSNDQILEELELMTDGGDWVNWKDGKDVAAMSRDKSDFAKSTGTEPVKVPAAVPEALRLRRKHRSQWRFEAFICGACWFLFHIPAKIPELGYAGNDRLGRTGLKQKKL
eukprot:s9597_g1.t1